jgi:hypothetical protein
MNIAQLSEHLKDVPQNRLIDYARNPNSVVPQFLALAEIQRRQQLSAQAQPPAATVAEDVLNQATAPQMPAQMPAPQMAQQLPENQPGVAQLPSGMNQGFAPGGLVAFSAGGEPESDEDYQDYLDKLESTKRRSNLAEMFAGLKDRVAGAMESLPRSYEETKKQYADSGDHSIDEEGFLAKLEHLESRGRDLNKKGTILTSAKGAEGRMQVMPKTQIAPGYGVEPARDNSLEEKARVGRDYGLAMLREFKDPQIAAMAYNWGPSNVKKWLASDKTMPVPKETLAYRSHFAKGGIASLAIGGSPEDYAATQDMEDKEAGYAASMINPSKSLAPGESIVTDQATEPTARSPFLDYLDQLKQEREDLKGQSKQDLALSVMQAGLGMLGSKSPYFLQGVGEGAQQGIGTFAALGKQRAADAAAIRKAYLGTLEAQHLYDYRQEQLKSLDENRKERLALAKEKVAQTGDIAQAKADERRLELTNVALRNAANNPEYKALVKERDNLPEDDPRRDILEQRMEAIKQSFINTALSGKYTAPVFPKVPVKEEEPGFWSKIGTGLSRIYGSGSSPQITQDQQNLLDKYK